METERLFTVREMAEMMGLHVQSVYERIKVRAVRATVRKGNVNLYNAAAFTMIDQPVKTGRKPKIDEKAVTDDVFGVSE